MRAFYNVKNKYVNKVDLYYDTLENNSNEIEIGVLIFNI